MVFSNWQFRFDPTGANIALLEYGDLMDAEPKFPLRRNLEIVPLVGADAPFMRLSGNAVVSVTYSIYPDESGDGAARKRVLRSLSLITALGRKPLRISVAGVTDLYWQFAACVVEAHSSGRKIHAAKSRLELTYTLTCTGLAEVVVP